jgi:hypothetical protein
MKSGHRPGQEGAEQQQVGQTAVGQQMGQRPELDPATIGWPTAALMRLPGR